MFISYDSRDKRAFSGAAAIPHRIRYAYGSRGRLCLTGTGICIRGMCMHTGFSLFWIPTHGMHTADLTGRGVRGWAAITYLDAPTYIWGAQVQYGVSYRERGVRLCLDVPAVAISKTLQKIKILQVSHRQPPSLCQMRRTVCTSVPTGRGVCAQRQNATAKCHGQTAGGPPCDRLSAGEDTPSPSCQTRLPLDCPCNSGVNRPC